MTKLTIFQLTLFLLFPVLAAAHPCEGKFTLIGIDSSKSKTKNDIWIQDEDGQQTTEALISYCPKHVSVKSIEIGGFGQALVRLDDRALANEADLKAVGSDPSDLFSIFNPGQNILASKVNIQFPISGEKIVFAGALTDEGGWASQEARNILFRDNFVRVDTTCSSASMSVEVKFKDSANDTDDFCHYQRN